MAGNRAPLAPSPGERGLASHHPAEVAELLDPAWACLERTAELVDLDARTRLPGWTARQLLVHLGTWDDDAQDERARGAGAAGQRDTVAQRVAEARSGLVEPAEDADARNARLVATHHDASRDELCAALRRARLDTSRYLLGDDVATTGTALVSSVVGPLPLTTVFVARAYELAVHASTWALTRRPGPTTRCSWPAWRPWWMSRSPGRADGADRVVRGRHAGGRLGGRAAGGSWTTSRLEPGRAARSLGWPGIEGDATDVLDASAGRVPAAQLLLTRRLRTYDVPGLMQLLPAIEGAPGAPGGAGIRAAARVMAGAGRAFGGVTSRIPLRR